MMFFAPRGRYEPCGMFNTPHLIGLAVCLTVIVVCLIFSRRMSDATYFRLIRFFSVVLACMEAFKIGFSFVNGYSDLNSWLPLSFCSIFIYSLFLIGYGKGIPKKMAQAYVSGACPAAGLAFLLVPTTSFQLYPFFHFQCFYSMFFHSSMMFFGISSLMRRSIPLNRRKFLLFALYYLAYAIVAMGLNALTEQNLMMLAEPFALPFSFVYAIYDFAPLLYSLFVSLVYLFPTWGFSFLISKILVGRKGQKGEKEENQISFKV
ncbi:MAG: YwaF family protein [Candidatus Borkfalkiaceae bacterium]|nr:YwaF family protein [Christensenellaceae bacterium]